MNLRAAVGIAAVIGGGVLAVFFWEARFLWFQGGFLGIALVVLGALDLVDSRRRRHGSRPRGIVEELREDLFGSRGNAADSQPDDDGDSR